MLFVSPPSGIADRMTGLVAAFLVALITRRALIIAPYPMSYELMYDQPHINWTVAVPPSEDAMTPVLWPPSGAGCVKCGDPAGGGPDPGMAASAKGSGEHAGIPCPVCEDSGVSVAYQNWINAGHTASWHRRQDFRTYFPAVHTIMYSSNRGASVSLFHNPHHMRELASLGLRASTAFGCVVNYLFFPRPETLATVEEEMRAVLSAELVIGIQIRTGDNYMDGQDMPATLAEKYRPHLQCALAIEEALGLPAPSYAALPVASGGVQLPLPQSSVLTPRWLLVSDSLAVRKAVLSWYGNKTIVHVRSKPAHVSTSGTKDLMRSRLAAAEHWLFGMTDYQVISWWSGFGRTAVMRGLREMSLWAVREDKPYECKLGGEEAAWEIGEAFSGVRRQRRR